MTGPWAWLSSTGHCAYEAGSIELGRDGLVVKAVGEPLEGLITAEDARELALAILVRWPSRIEQPSVPAIAQQPHGYYRLRAFTTSACVWDAFVPYGFPIPEAGEEYEIGEQRYTVGSWVWDSERSGHIELTLHVRKNG